MAQKATKGKFEAPKPVKVFVGLLITQLFILPQVYKLLEEKLGAIDLKSQLMDFNFTRYYEAEMGLELKRQFLSFHNLMSPDELVEIKLFTRELEQSLAKEGKRLVNLDPGYLTPAKIVLASTKDFSHRLYLGQGIYGEVTLLFRHKRFEPLPWTYPDYHTEAYQRFFYELRAQYMAQLKGESI